MLIFQRRWNESVIIGNKGEIKITVLDINFKNQVVKLGIIAPREIIVHRHEVYSYLSHNPEEKRR